MKKGFFKKLMAAAATMLLTIGSVMPAAAADISQVNDTCSITLHLYGNNSASEHIGTGTIDDSSFLPTEAVPIQNASFRYKKVGEVVQYNDGKEVGIRYKITDSAFADAVGVNNQNATSIDGNHYIVTDVMMQNLMTNAVKSENGERLNMTLLKICTEDTKKTNASGEVTVTGCNGLYVFIDGEKPTTVVSHVTPFLVAAPMPNLDGTGWNTTIHAYPKVANSEMTLTKTASQGTEGTNILVQSGEPITYSVTLKVPGKKDVGELDEFKKFVLSDVMPAGVKSIYGQGASGLKINDTQLKVARDEIAVTAPTADNGNTTSVILLEGGLEVLNEALKLGDATVTLTYQAVLGQGATLGKTGNSNSAKVVYQRTMGDEGTITTTSNVHTYGIDVNKVLSDNEAVGNKDIRFTLKKVAGDNKTPMTFEQNIINVGGTSTTTYWVNSTGTSELKVPADGKLRLYGLLPGTYELEETKSANGYTKLDKPIRIVITAPENADQYSTSNATATADGESMTTDSQNAFQLTVVNTSQTTGFTLPKTGGEGTLAALAIGFGLVGFAVVMLVYYRSKNKAAK